MAEVQISVKSVLPTYLDLVLGWECYENQGLKQAR